MNAGPAPIGRPSPGVNGPTLHAQLDEHESIVLECLSLASRIDMGLHGPKAPEIAEAPKEAVGVADKVLRHNQRLALLRELLLSISQRVG